MDLSKIKVLVVDDSIMFRKSLEAGLANDLNIQVVGTASDAIDAMEKIKQLNPQVVTLDVEMPKVNGIDFLKQLMPVHPLPVVVVSSLPINALDALQAGAVDFVRKPAVRTIFDMNDFISDLTIKIKIAANARLPKQKKSPISMGFATPPPSPSPVLPPLKNGYDKRMVIAIGASTGGTEATLEVIKDLPITTPGIIVVQHMPPVFTNMYAQRLDRICKMHVKEAKDGDRVEPGKIIIAAGEYHLRLHQDTIGYYISSKQGPKVSGHCPSVDVMFDSVASTAKQFAIGIILTGMGADGAEGITKLRSAGSYTIGQDQETCVVYGMPMEALKRGGIVKECSLETISGEVIRYLNSKIF